MPGKAFSTLEWISGRKPFISAALNRLESTLSDYDFFMSSEFSWDHGNGDMLQAELIGKDQQSFNIDTSSMHWPSYIATVRIFFNVYLDIAR